MLDFWVVRCDVSNDKDVWGGWSDCDEREVF